MRSAKRAGSAAVIAVLMTVAGAAAPAFADDKPDFPPMEKVVEGLSKVVSTADGSTPLYELYEDRETGKLLAALSRGYENQMLMVACTVSGGDSQAGVMGPTHYVKWQKLDKQLMLVAPNLGVRTDGDKQAKDSVEHLYTGRVLLSVPIVSKTADGRPIIDLGAIATQQSGKFFGPSPFGGYGPSAGAINARLARLTKAKAFPENIVVEYEAPRAGSGQLVRLTYSIGTLEGTPGYEPRNADPRVGYFYDSHQDFARNANADVTDRYISRWNLEKADPKLKMSPPKQPIVWYVENTVPVRYRRYVREGIEMWNKAYEEIGIIGALEVYQQDTATGAHMDKDPEDARYNFFRWNVTNQGYAIGPSRTNPYTGEILDADVVWHQGLTRSLRANLETFSDDFSDETFSAETLAWFEDHPDWDPRMRLASPERAAHRMALRSQRVERAASTELGDPSHPWTPGTNSTNMACKMGNMLAMDFALAGAALESGLLDVGAEGDDIEMLDGIPEAFYSQIIRYISAHEVGHCLGLQHNMTSSTINSLEAINSPDFSGPMIGSVMEYAAVNLNHGLGEVQGPYSTTEVGPYDKWAIAFGYGPKDKVDEVLSRVAEPGHIWVPQQAMVAGNDPRNVTWDMGADNLEFARSRISLVADLRARLVSEIVDDGESWANVRRRYGAFMNTHVYSLVIASNWVGGSFYNNDFKGDPGDRVPVEEIPADRQREALSLVLENSFHDKAFGFTPELLAHMGKEHWWDAGGIGELLSDPNVPVHNVVGGVQATALSLVMNPTTLRRVYDNEFKAQDPNPFTMAELITTVTDEAWSDVGDLDRGGELSSFRRNLQQEHIGRLSTLALLDGNAPALRTIGQLATAELRRIDSIAERGAGTNPGPYTSAHLADVRARIARTLDAAYVVER
ncbi:MAG: hypothetical protein DHS20C14_09270 [Phycisphaeraceae bacterium]|nr:MAG: hypothetical protein DHS20C14_09270 [Phycisphaeraceae bacterium]